MERTIVRFIARWGIHHEPRWQEVRVSLEKHNERWYIKSPWAMIDATQGEATTDEQMASILGRNHFATEKEAQAHANAMSPHWHNDANQTILGRLHDAIRWDGHMVGIGKLADALDMSTEQVYRIGRGEAKATNKQAAAASAYHGCIR